jgi:uncharacterized protein (DUF1330 family)
MPAYLISNMSEVVDPDLLKEYAEKTGPTVAAHGGKRIAGGAVEVLEGEFVGDRTVVLEFPDMAALKGWYNSDEYKPLIAMRQQATRGNVIVVDGG